MYNYSRLKFAEIADSDPLLNKRWYANKNLHSPAINSPTVNYFVGGLGAHIKQFNYIRAFRANKLQRTLSLFYICATPTTELSIRGTVYSPGRRAYYSPVRPAHR